MQRYMEPLSRRPSQGEERWTEPREERKRASVWEIRGVGGNRATAGENRRDTETQSYGLSDTAVTYTR